MLQSLNGNKKGVSTIEILVVIGIIGVTLTSVFSLTNLSLKTTNLIKQTVQAAASTGETMEQVRNFRDQTSWDADGLGTLNIDTAYHAEKTGGNPPKWTFVSGEENIDGFLRKVVFEKVFRDSNDNITETGSEDPDTRKVTVTVSWQERGRSHKVETISYFTNWHP